MTRTRIHYRANTGVVLLYKIWVRTEKVVVMLKGEERQTAF